MSSARIAGFPPRTYNEFETSASRFRPNTGDLAFGLYTMSKRWLSIAALLAILGPSLVSSGGAQEVQRIVALVNDDVISLYDLHSRVRLALVSSGLQPTPENTGRLQPQVLRGLIDEKLQSQEANRLGISVGETEINESISRIEQTNQMRPGGFDEFIRQANVERATIYEQIRVGLAWQKVIQRRLRPSLEVSDEEIDEQIERLSTGQGRTENLLAEIFLAVDSPDQDDEVRQTAMGLIEQMVRGASFASIARQFSQSASAGSGGDVGWIQSGQFEEAINAAIEALRPGQITPPMRSIAGYYVYLLRDRHTTAGPQPGDATVTLAQLALPLPANPKQSDIDSQSSLLRQVREVVSGCADLERATKELRGQFLPPGQRLKISDLNPAVRPVVGNLKVGELSDPMPAQGGLIALMVCEREQPKVNLPSRDDISDALTRQRLDLVARRYLRDLRRAAVVDIRA